MYSERYETGLAMLRQVDGKGGEAVVESLKGIAPDFALPHRISLWRHLHEART